MKINVHKIYQNHRCINWLLLAFAHSGGTQSKTRLHNHRHGQAFILKTCNVLFSLMSHITNLSWLQWSLWPSMVRPRFDLSTHEKGGRQCGLSLSRDKACNSVASHGIPSTFASMRLSVKVKDQPQKHSESATKFCDDSRYTV